LHSRAQLREQLLIWGMRQWVAGRENWPCVERAFRKACSGASGLAAASAFADTVGMIAASARRSVNCFALECGNVSKDEMAILALVAASQADDRRHAEAQARALMPDSMVPVLLQSVSLLGTALSNSRRELPPRYAYPAPDATIH
jgi:hypothetical protein